MHHSIVRSENQDEKELRLRLLELEAIKEEACQKEAELSLMMTNLSSFRDSYDILVTRKKEELQKFQQLIEDALNKPPASQANSEIRSVYRQLAKLIHPDLSSNANEAESRRDLMLQANQALDEGDIETLRSMLSSLQGHPDGISRTLVRTRLELVKSQISLTRKRLTQATVGIMRTTQNEMYKVMLFHNQCAETGVDHLAELSHQLDIEIAQAQSRLKTILQREDD